ncbi:hypothetical protein NJ76_25870 [Rhodococcus sp. IITR03]|nr:hypothetical protein NJ76_25870 [Rhodococcus sp. IITR03]
MRCRRPGHLGERPAASGFAQPPAQAFAGGQLFRGQGESHHDLQSNRVGMKIPIVALGWYLNTVL